MKRGRRRRRRRGRGVQKFICTDSMKFSIYSAADVWLARFSPLNIYASRDPRLKLLHNCYSHRAWKIKAEYRENKADASRPKWPITRRSLVPRLSLVIFVSAQTSFLPPGALRRGSGSQPAPSGADREMMDFGVVINRSIGVCNPLFFDSLYL